MEVGATSYEFRFFRLEERFPFRDLPVVPTVCLLVADRIEPPYEYVDELGRRRDGGGMWILHDMGRRSKQV
jgi:hypothetical protein